MGSDEESVARENERLRARLAALEQEVGGVEAPFLKSVLAALPALITRLDDRGVIRFLNRYLPGHAPENVLGRSVFDFIAPGDIPVARACIERVLATGETGRYRIAGAGPAGETRHYETIVVPVEDHDGARGACLVSLDVTEQVLREQALRSSEESLQLAVAATGVGLWRWEIATETVTWNETMHAIAGFERPLGSAEYVETLVHPDDRASVREFLGALIESDAGAAEPPWRMHRIVRKDGTVRSVLPSGHVIRDARDKPVAVVGGMLDITEQRAREERLRQTQKLEALGSLTAGVAHNFNNMLAVILPFIELVVEHPEQPNAELARAAQHSAQRAADMVRQLMMLAGKRRGEAKATRDVARLVTTASEICRRLFGDQPGLELRIDDAPLLVHCDEAALEQVLVNLLLNARDALATGAPARPRVEV
jgi:PAS domain S-box-containing protein